MKRIKYLLAAGLLLAGLGGAVYGTAPHTAPPAHRHGPHHQAVQASDPAPLAEEEMETNGYDLKTNCRCS